MQAELNFLRPAARALHWDLTRRDWAAALPLERRTVEIAELPLSGDPAAELAQRGFTAAPLHGEVAFDPRGDAWREPFAQAVARTLSRLVGCRGVAIAPAGLTIRRGRGAGDDRPLTLCHADFTAPSAVAKFAAVPAGRGARRFAAYNLWWLAGGPPQDVPLALCDATTVSPSDMTPVRTTVPIPGGGVQGFGELAVYRWNPRQRWFWYPELTSARLLVFAGHDSDAAFASQVPHSAFVNPGCPPEAPTRVSVESRCFAYW